MWNKISQRLFIVWAAMLASVALYVVITLFFIAGKPPAIVIDSATGSILKIALALMSAFNIAVMRLIDGRLRSPDGVRGFLQSRGAAVSGAEGKTEALAGHYFQLCVVRWALVEAVAVFGLVLAIITSETLVPSIFYLAAAVFLANLRPREEQLEEMIRASRRA